MPLSYLPSAQEELSCSESYHQIPIYVIVLSAVIAPPCLGEAASEMMGNACARASVVNLWIGLEDCLEQIVSDLLAVEQGMKACFNFVFRKRHWSSTSGYSIQIWQVSQARFTR